VRTPALPTILIVALPLAARGEPAVEEIAMFVGEQRVFGAHDVEGYSEGAPGIVQIKIPRDARSLVITAVQVGRTSVLLLRRHARPQTLLVTVYQRPPEVVRRELMDLLEGLPEVHVRQVGSRFFVEGTLPDDAQVARAQQIAALYGEQVTNLVTLDPTRVDRKINVKLDVHFVEFTRRSGYQAGVSWPANLLGQGALSASYDLLGGQWTVATYTITSSAMPSLDLLSMAGWAKVLKQSTLVATNGTTARYRAGGEVNVRVAGVAGGELRTIPFGSDVQVTPRYNPQSGRIDLLIEAEAAELGDAVDGVPSRSLSKVSTRVHLEAGQSVMISGVHARAARETHTGLPLLRHLPIVGLLFRSDAAGDDENEGAIFITPTVIHEVGDADRRRMREMIDRYRVFGG
jgi:pilus assembly protein CpaC